MRVSIIIPCYNESGNIFPLYALIQQQLVPGEMEIIFVDDGSSDNTLAELKQLSAQDKQVHYLSFSRNFGHQYALKAGLDYASGDCVISMDADLQHPPNLLGDMIAKWKEGYDIVYTQRQEDRSLSFVKRTTSSGFYKLMNVLSDTHIEDGVADFRLLDKQVVQVLKNLDEKNIFMRGLISWMGFKTYKISYLPGQRHAGTTKYSLGKMLRFALTGITSFSTKPLLLSMFLGLTISAASFLYILYALGMYFLTDKAVSGWTSILVSVLFIGGIQLIILGIIGVYIGKIFIQVKGRPSYIIREASRFYQH